MPDDDDDERLLEPQEAIDAEREGVVESLEAEEREEDDAEADFEEEVTPEEKAAHFRDLIGRVHGIFQGNVLDEATLEGLSVDEQLALKVLTEAVRGSKLSDEGDMVYAENRLAMLNHALAVLQPTLALGLAPELGDLRETYDVLVDEVTTLRDHLDRLSDAQEEMFAQDREVEQAEGADEDDPDDKKDDPQPPKPKPPAPLPVPEPGEPPRPSTLAGKPGEPAVQQPARPTTVWDGNK